ncbi:serine hydrolase [Bdellovibrio sp. NC01]|uniref:serine hydrolase domain-containing protein n=1 Tax=Bdellovibrio sp. NC01 TaxID=2220073 RepID=UPI00115B7D58|nr:serine hydrolase [Bdellovibrio sp. NC01]QDK37747.1 D-alanyl-D-alanine carboxypeptidase [Bdellovibrio sp. NC01]
MKYSVLEKNLITQLEDRIRDTTPGVMVRAYQGGKIICDIAVGNTYAYYDLASLTKIIFTQQAMMWAFELGKWNFDTKVSELLSWFPHKETKLTELLTHSSGLVWWAPFYQELNQSLPRDQRREQLRGILQNLKIEKQDTAVYSDVGFIVLSYVLEKLFDKEILEVWNEIKNKFYLGTTLEFHPDNLTSTKQSLFAPTEECPVRRKLVQGEVHDLNCWAMGGVSTHAGLFGSIDDAGWYSLHLRSQLMGIARYSIRQKTAQLFARRALPEGKGDWAMGYMMPTPGSASCGSYFSLDSIGHTGFTGTSIWYDPKMDMSIIVLSNRVLYGSDNKAFSKLRPEIHNWIVENYRRSGV